MTGVIMWVGVTPTEQSKGYGQAIVTRLVNYLVSLGVTDLAAENVIAPEFFSALGFTHTPTEEDPNRWFRPKIKAIQSFQRPSELVETDIRIVQDDFRPERLNHLIAWYRVSDGAAVAKVRIRIE